MKPWNTTKNDVKTIDKLCNLLAARTYLRKSINILDEAELNNCYDNCIDFELALSIKARRVEVLVLWQEVNNYIEMMR